MRVVKVYIVTVFVLMVFLIFLFMYAINGLAKSVASDCPKGVVYCLGEATSKIQKDFKDGSDGR